MSKPMFLCHASTNCVDTDKALVAALLPFLTRRKDCETSLQQYHGLPIYEWHYRYKSSAHWVPSGQPILYKAPK